MRYRFIRLIVGFLLGVSIAGILPVAAQIPPLEQWQNFPLGQDSLSLQGYSSQYLYFDGRPLFRVTAATAPVISQNALQETPPLAERVDSIEQVLQETLQVSLSTPAEGQDSFVLNIVVEEDEKTGLFVIRLNDRWLMTVTDKDALANGRSNTNLWAREVKEILSERLQQAARERHPRQILRQLGLTMITLAVLVLINYGLSQRSRYLFERWKELLTTQGSSDTPVSLPPLVSSSEPDKMPLRLKGTWLTSRNLCYLQIRCLQLVQLGVWGGGLFFTLGLLPYTRGMQPIILRTLPIPLKILGLVVAVYLALRITEIVLDRFFLALESDRLLEPHSSKRLEKRFITIAQVSNGFATMVILTSGGLVGLSLLGVEIGPILAGAGIIGLGLSLASQGLIKDFINGFFIITEDQYAVGDVIKVGEYAGLVENINLRITQIRNGEGSLITLPNSSITVVENLSKEWSRANILFTVSYQADLNQVLEIVAEVTEDLSRDLLWSSRILNPAEVIGVEHISQEGVTLLVWIRTKPLEQWSVGREFRRRLKYALDAQGIEMGIPQQKVFYNNAHPLESHLPTTDPPPSNESTLP